MRRKTLWIFSIALLLMVGQFIAASAQELEPEGPSDDDVNEIASEMYCPVCENIPLDVCETQACEQWRELIRQKLAEGWNSDEIKNYFVLQYGDRVLAEPPRQGLNWLVYIVPPLVFVLGIAGLVFYNRRPKEQQNTPPLANDVDPVYLQKLEDEINQRKDLHRD